MFKEKQSDGNLSLGHVRLSINDLSEAGNQPMFSEDGSIVLVANGEIYNSDPSINKCVAM